MKRLTLLATAIVFACTASLWAQGVPTVVSGSSIGNGTIGQGGKNEAATYISTIEKVVVLTDEQKKAMTEIIDARQKAVADYWAANAAKLKAATKVQDDASKQGDREAIEKAQTDYLALVEPVTKLTLKSGEDLDKVLTPEQVAKFDELHGWQMIESLTEPAVLTEEQIKKLTVVGRNYVISRRKGVRGANIMATLENTLTFGQKKLIVKTRLLKYVKDSFRGVTLTADQVKQIDVICDEAAKGQDLSNQYTVYQDTFAKASELLTDKQRESLPRQNQ